MGFTRGLLSVCFRINLHPLWVYFVSSLVYFGFAFGVHLEHYSPILTYAAFTLELLYVPNLNLLCVYFGFISVPNLGLLCVYFGFTLYIQSWSTLSLLWVYSLCPILVYFAFTLGLLFLPNLGLLYVYLRLHV